MQSFCGFASLIKYIKRNDFSKYILDTYVWRKDKHRMNSISENSNLRQL